MNKDLEKITKNYIVRDRSNFQLKHFVIGQHDTPEMRYRQILIEAKSLLFRIKHVEIEIEIIKRKIEKLEASKDEVKHLKAAQKRLSLGVTLETLEAAKGELNYLIELSKEYSNYTLEEIEANQSKYWEKRLIRQATTDRIALDQGISTGNAESLINVNLINIDFTADLMQKQLEFSEKENLTIETL